MTTVPQLRPLGIGEILDVGIKITLRHWWTLARTVLVVVVPFQLVATIVDLSASEGVLTTGGETGTVEVDEVWTFAAAVLVALVLTLLAQTIATGACFKAVADAYLGLAPSWRRSLAEVFRRLHSIVWISVLTYVLGFLALFPCVAPGVWLFISWTVAIPVLLTESVKGRRALGRSFRLVKGFWWRTFAIVILGTLLASIIEVSITGVLGIMTVATDSEVVDIVAGFASAVAAGVITTPFVAAVTIVLYIDLRVRKEGFDLALLAARMGVDAPTGDALAIPAPPPVERSPYVPGPPRPTGGKQPPYWPPPPGWTPDDEGS